MIPVDAMDASLMLHQIPAPRETARVSLASDIRTEVFRQGTVTVTTLVYFTLVPEEPARVAKGRGVTSGAVAFVRSEVTVHVLPIFFFGGHPPLASIIDFLLRKAHKYEVTKKNTHL